MRANKILSLYEAVDKEIMQQVMVIVERLAAVLPADLIRDIKGFKEAKGIDRSIRLFLPKYGDYRDVRATFDLDTTPNRPGLFFSVVEVMKDENGVTTGFNPIDTYLIGLMKTISNDNADYEIEWLSKPKKIIR